MMAESLVSQAVGIEGERWAEGNDDVKVINTGFAHTLVLFARRQR